LFLECPQHCRPVLLLAPRCCCWGCTWYCGENAFNCTSNLCFESIIGCTIYTSRGLVQKLS
jgi:hypothetical protein